jgi:biopolymer transport protein ExbB
MNWIFLCLVALFAQADSLKVDSTPPVDAAPAASAGDDAKAETPAAKPAIDATSTTPQAETAPPADTAAKESQSSWLNDLLHTGAMKYMIAGGVFMWPILFLGILALGVIIERFRALMMLNTRAEELRSKVRGLLENDEVEEALQLCDREQGPVPAILAAGLRKYLVARRLGYDAAKIEEQVVKGMDDYSIHIVAAMEKHLPILATVSSAAPMLGFLGTVEGMVFSFDEIVRMHGQQDIVLSAASGIMVSLLTTVLGLLVGLPAFIAFNYFTSAINEFVLDVEESAAELIEAVTLQLALAGNHGHAVAKPRETPVAT